MNTALAMAGAMAMMGFAAAGTREIRTVQQVDVELRDVGERREIPPKAAFRIWPSASAPRGGPVPGP
jgi:hypothetical protein